MCVFLQPAGEDEHVVLGVTGCIVIIIYPEYFLPLSVCVNKLFLTDFSNSCFGKKRPNFEKGGRICAGLKAGTRDCCDPNGFTQKMCHRISFKPQVVLRLLGISCHGKYELKYPLRNRSLG